MMIKVLFLNFVLLQSTYALSDYERIIESFNNSTERIIDAFQNNNNSPASGRPWKHEQGLPSATDVKELIYELRAIKKTFQDQEDEQPFSITEITSGENEERLKKQLQELNEENERKKENIRKQLDMITSLFAWQQENQFNGCVNFTECANITKQEITKLFDLYQTFTGSQGNETQIQKNDKHIIQIDESDCSTTVDGQCFTYHEDRRTWWHARQDCRRYGGDLAGHKYFPNLIPITEDEMYYGTNLSLYMWLGATDLDEDNHWKWVDGVELSNDYSRWGKTEPDAGDTDHCLSVGIKMIYDRNCRERNSYLCEIPMTD